MFRQWRLRKRCQVLVGLCSQASLQSYIEACAGQTVDKLINTPMISVDLELTGLDARHNQIIAIGWTKIDHGKIRFRSNRHIVVNSAQSVGHSAAIHELTDSEVAMGAPLETGLKALFKAAKGRVWIFMRKRRDVPVHHGDLQLGKLRARYNLPRYTAHNALIDACATAELALAIAAKMDPAGSLNLRAHMKYY